MALLVNTNAYEALEDGDELYNFCNIACCFGNVIYLLYQGCCSSPSRSEIFHILISLLTLCSVLAGVVGPCCHLIHGVPITPILHWAMRKSLG